MASPRQPASSFPATETKTATLPNPRTPETTPATPTTAVEKTAMPPRGSQRGGGRGGGAARREADLSSLLAAAQRDELVLLVATITDTMLQQISQVFEEQPTKTMARVPSNVAGNPDIARPGLGTRHGPFSPSRKPLQSLNSQGQDQVANITNTATTAATVQGGAASRDGIQAELKKEAVAAFQRWQTAVTKRMSEIVVAGDQFSQFGNTNNTRGSARHPGPGRGPLGRASTGRFNGPGRRGGPNNIRSDANAASPTCPPQNTGDTRTLLQLPMEKRQLLLHAVLLLLLSLENYSAYSRTLLLRVAAHLRIPLQVVATDEARVGKSLASAAESVWTEEGLLKKSDDGKREKRGRPGAGPPGHLPATLAPPVNAAKVGYLVGGPGIGPAAAATVLGNLGTLADGGLATCIFFGMCGLRGSPAKTLETFTRDIQDVSLVPLHGVGEETETCNRKVLCSKDKRLRLTIGISGWLQKEDDDYLPWRVLGDKSEAYALSWEKETMAKVGASLDTVARSLAWQNAKQEFMNRNVLASLKAFQWPADLLKISKIVDNPWSVGMVRADKVGIALADAIVHKIPGERGVSLLGYGLGARVIYTCLMSLSERRMFGLVENVIMMGTPAPSSYCVWAALRSVVVGRVINVFSENDCMLGFLHRTGCVQFGVAGLQRIQGVYGIENVDATKPITSHLRYAPLVGRILKDVGWEDLDTAAVQKSEEALTSAEKAQEQKPQNRPTDPRGPVSPKNGRKKTGRRKLDTQLDTQLQALSIAH